MKRSEARLDEKKEYESNIGKYRLEHNITQEKLAEMCNCHPGAISDLQTGMMSPFYERSVMRDGVVHGKGATRPYVLIMSEIFEKSVAELFPRYVCEIKREDSFFVRLKESYTDEGNLIKEIDRDITMDKFWDILESRIIEYRGQGVPRLTRKKFGMLKREFHDGFNQVEIGQEYGRTRSLVSSANLNSLRIVRNMLNLKKFEGLREGLVDCLRDMD